MPRKTPTVSIEVPADLAPALRSLIEHVGQFTLAARTSKKVDFAAAERVLGSLVGGLECSAVAGMLESLDPTAEQVEVDGAVYRRMNLEVHGNYLGLRGEVRVKRGLYRLEGVRNGATVVPVDLHAGIVEGRYTPAAAKLAALLAQEVPSRSADTICRSAGVLPHSRAAQDRIGVALGERWEKLRKGAETELVEALEIPAAATTVSVAVDRISLPMAEPRPATPDDIAAGVEHPIAVNYRMAFVGAVTLYDEKAEPLTTIRHAHVADGGAASLEASFRRDLLVLLRRRGDLRVVTLADGAPEMQNILDRATAGITVTARIVDFYHCVEHLAAAIGATGRHVPDLLADWKGDLLTKPDAVEGILLRLRTWEQGYAAEALPPGLHGALTYLENHCDRLRYQAAREAGLPIGSGTVEATGKTVVQVRMKRAGARWLPVGAQSIMGLRAAATSSGDRWDATMARVLKSYTKDVKAPKRSHIRKQSKPFVSQP